MFNIGFGELAIICIVLIVAVGPERLPSMMKTLGKTLRTLRQASRDIRASTGIDELMREDFDFNAPPRRPYVPPVVQPPPAAEQPIARAALPESAAEQPVPAQPALTLPSDAPITTTTTNNPNDPPPPVAAPPQAAVPPQAVLKPPHES